MTRQEAEDYIYSSYMKAAPFSSYDTPDSRRRHPEYTADIIKKLYRGTPSIAVTGSKGKGSVAYILSAILEGYGKTGLMTGPHIESFNERFRVGAELISDDELTEIVESLKPLFDEISPHPRTGGFISPIGIETAVAESFFFRRDTDFDIYEHGKGVRYDDVKNIPASYGIINSVFLEHTRELGNTLHVIASDKADIIREGMRGVFTGWQRREVSDIIKRRAEKYGIPLKLAGRDFDISDVRYQRDGMSCTVKTARRSYEDLKISLMGVNQCRNLALAIACAEDIIGDAFCKEPYEERVLRESLKSLFWFGRLTVAADDPLLLIDCCINRESAEAALLTIRSLTKERAVFILAIPDDKDYMGVAKAVDSAGHDIMLTKVKNRYYRFDGIQQEMLKRAGISCRYAGSLCDAVSDARDKERPAVILGTTAMLPEIKGYIEGRI